MKLIKDTMLTSAMGFAWDLIHTGECIVEFSENWDLTEASDLRAGLVERLLHKTGCIVTSAGERLEPAVNNLSMLLGYNDGEVAGMVAWPALAK